MNPIERAEAVLSAVRARHPAACLPGAATSPADLVRTLVLGHEFIAGCDRVAHREVRRNTPAQSARTDPGTNPAAERCAVGIRMA